MAKAKISKKKTVVTLTLSGKEAQAILDLTTMALNKQTDKVFDALMEVQSDLPESNKRWFRGSEQLFVNELRYEKSEKKPSTDF